MIKTHHALVMDRGVWTINTAVTSGAVYIVSNPLGVTKIRNRMGEGPMTGRRTNGLPAS